MVNRTKRRRKRQTAPKNRTAKPVKKVNKEKTVAAHAAKMVRRDEDLPPLMNARSATRLGASSQAAATPEDITTKSATPPRATERPRLTGNSDARTPKPRPANRLIAVPELPTPTPASPEASPALIFNQKLLEFARDNAVANFDFALSLFAARTPLDVLRLQGAFVTERLKAFTTQACELTALFSSGSMWRVGR
jgi:hypothetical protein